MAQKQSSQKPGKEKTEDPPQQAEKSAAGGIQGGEAKKGTPIRKKLMGAFQFNKTVRCSYARFIGMIIFLIVLTSWIFMLGYITGSGGDPRQSLSRFTAQNNADNSQKKKTEPSAVLNDTADKVKQPEQLSAPVIQDKPAPDKQDTPIQAKAPEQPPKPQVPKYHFVFQTAVFKGTDTKGPASIQKIMKKAGYSTTVEKRGKLNAVLVHLRGTDEDASKLRQLCIENKLGDPMLRSRSSIGNRKNR